MVETKVKVQCSNCGRKFDLSMKDYKAEQDYVEEAKDHAKGRGAWVQGMRPWFCGMPCLNEYRVKKGS